MQATSIEWTDCSVNPFRARDLKTGAVGHFCVKISAGCQHCYSARMQKRFGMHEFVRSNREKVELFLDENVLKRVISRRKPTKMFWCDMTDMFLDDYPDEWIDRCFAVMALTPQHTHQVLTKRPQRMRDYLCNRETWMRLHDEIVRIASRDCLYELTFSGLLQTSDAAVDYLKMPLNNLWLGVSVENQSSADERIPVLLQIPAEVRFISVEPLLGPIHIDDTVRRARFAAPIFSVPDMTIDWVIVGGESGPKARPCDIEWIRSVVRQCKNANVPCFVKQFGSNVLTRNDAGFEGDTRCSWPMDTNVRDIDPFGQGAHVQVLLRNRKGGDPSEWPKDLRVREFPSSVTTSAGAQRSLQLSNAG